jgi:Na+-transporting NADH:ubiquinone oxidoreductase subunit B
VYYYGWRALAIILTCNVAGYFVERSFTRNWKEPVSSAVLVTGTLLALSLPPMLPLWMAALGSAFGVLFGKMVFGGFGRNVFNPAMTGRAFLYVSFGKQMTSEWSAPYGGFPGGLLKWGRSLAEVGEKLADGTTDAIATATPFSLMRLSPEAWIERGVTDPPTFSTLKMLLGGYGSVLGDASVLLVILGGIYLLQKKTANYRIVVGGLLGFAVMQTLAWLLGWRNALDPLHAAISGSLLLGLFFYATDPITASTIDRGRWIFGIFVGAMSVLIATFSSWAAGMMFAILLANMFVPLLDNVLKKLYPPKKAAPRPKPQAAAPAKAAGGAA